MPYKNEINPLLIAFKKAKHEARNWIAGESSFKPGDVVKVEHDDLSEYRDGGSLRGQIGTVQYINTNDSVGVVIWSRPDHPVIFWPDELEHVRQT
jgi:hypothetical protein